MINVKVEEINTEEVSYPCLMIDNENNTVVLFVSERAGTVIESDDLMIGYYDNTWVSELFKPFNGRITLSNGRK